MTNETKSHEARDFQEQLQWWSQMIDSAPAGIQAEREELTEIAESITGAMGNPGFNRWYEVEADPWFVEAFDIASDLELPANLGFKDTEIEQAWNRLTALIKALEMRYINNDPEQAESVLENTLSFRERYD